MTERERPSEEIPSQGSARKPGATSPAAPKDGEWRVGSIAWNAEGKLLVLDRDLARKLEAQVRAEKRLELGVAPADGATATGDDGQTAALLASAGSTILPPKGPILNLLCPCNVDRSSQSSAIHT